MNNEKEKYQDNAPINFKNIGPLSIEKYKQYWEQTKNKIDKHIEELVEDDTDVFEPLVITPEECERNLNDTRVWLDEMEFLESFIGHNKVCPKCNCSAVKIFCKSPKKIDYFYCASDDCGWYHESPICIELAELFERLYHTNRMGKF